MLKYGNKTVLLKIRACMVMILAIMTILLSLYVSSCSFSGDEGRTASSGKSSFTLKKVSPSALKSFTSGASASRNTESLSSATATAADNASANTNEGEDNGHTDEAPDNLSGDSQTGDNNTDIQDPDSPDASIKIDLRGRIFTMITYSGYFTEDESNLSGLVSREIERCEQKYNFRMNWESRRYSQIQKEFPSAFLAGINYSDVFFTNRSYAFPGWVDNNMIVCMDDHIDFENGPYANSWQLPTVWKGKHYGLNTSTINVALYLLTYNKKLLANEGLPDIFTLQQNKRWNWENMLYVAIRTTKDTDGDGMIDQWGIDGDYVDFISKLVISNNTDFITDLNVKPQYNLSSLPALQALQFSSDLYNVHRVAVPPSFAADGYFASGRAAIYSSYNYYSTAVFPQDCGLAFYPMGPNAQDYRVATTGGPFMVIPTTAENPEQTAVILADIWDLWNENNTEYISMDDIFRQRIETYVYNNNDFTTCYSAIKKLYQLSHINYNEFREIIETEIIRRIIREYMPVVSVVQSFRERAQLALDSVR